MIGRQRGSTDEQARYRAWASNDDWSTTEQSDNYPFKPSDASQVNHGRTLQDLLIRSPAGSAHDIAIRASTAYAGAISSVQYRSQELIHATIGAGVQFHLRYADGDLVKGTYAFNECENPTEAGNSRDMANLPQQGPSSSYLESFQVQQDPSGRPRIVTRNAPVDFTPPGSTSDSDYGAGRCTNRRTEWFTGYFINKWVTIGWQSPLTKREFGNVIQIDARIDVPVAHHDMRALQVEFITYLRRWAQQQAAYSATDGGRLDFGGDGFATGGGEKGGARAFFNVDGTFGVAMLPFHNQASAPAGDAPGHISREVYREQPSVYSEDVEQCMECTPPRPFTKRTLQADWHFSRPGPSVSVHAFVVLGTREEIKHALDAIVASAKQTPGPHVFRD